MVSESAPRFAGTLLSLVRTPSPALLPEGGPESLTHLVLTGIYKNQPNQPSPSHDKRDTINILGDK
ncbi:hypothetical protein PoB_004435000, partial [Plakobranchus ocellatus]